MHLAALVDGVVIEMYTTGGMLFAVCGLGIYMLVCVDYSSIIVRSARRE